MIIKRLFGFNYFYFEHVYPSNGKFTISYIGENRNAPIRNIDGGNSISVKFYVSTTITIDPALGANHSPVLKAPPVDRGAIGQVFLHNPGAFDADGDSLSFHLRECQDVPLGVVGVSGPLRFFFALGHRGEHNGFTSG